MRYDSCHKSMYQIFSEHSKRVVSIRPSYIYVIIVSIGLLFIFSCTITNVSANEQVIVCRGETLQISVRLLMNGTYGDPVPYQIVEFFDETNNQFIGSLFTDLNGHASIDWHLPLNYSLGVTIVNATFRGNDTYALTPSYQRESIIIQASTNLRIQIERTSLVPGDQMIFTILLMDDNMNPLSNESVDVFCGSTFLISGKTNNTGQAKFVINCNQSWGNLGSNNIKVIYKGNLKEFYTSCEKSFLINMNRIKTSIETYRHIPYYFVLNDTLELSLIIKANEVPLSNVTINVFSDDYKLTNVITNESGVVILPFTVCDTFDLGLHVLTFEYLGAERYDSSFLTVNFAVVSPAIIKTELLADCIIGEESIMRVYLFDCLGRPIQNASIVLSDSVTNQSFMQEIYSNTSFSDFQLQIEGPKGVRDYNIEIIGNEYIMNRTNSFTLLIWSKPSFAFINSSIMGYASPAQKITFGIRLSDYSSNCSNRIILLSSTSGSLNMSSKTNHFGVAVINLSVPTQEGGCELSIIYEGNESKYELSAYYLYTFFITRMMPVKVELQYYSVVPSLQQLQLNLKVIAFNGSALGGIGFIYEWLNMTGYISSANNGRIGVCLPVPSEKGLYSFSYRTTPSGSVQSCSGLIILTINEQDAACSQGVGIVSIAVSIGASLGIISIPRIMRKRMIGL